VDSAKEVAADLVRVEKEVWHDVLLSLPDLLEARGPKSRAPGRDQLRRSGCGSRQRL
jgi:hypothetical protein